MTRSGFYVGGAEVFRGVAGVARVGVVLVVVGLVVVWP